MPSSPTERRSRIRRTADRIGHLTDSTYRYRAWMYVALVLWTTFLFWRMGENQDSNREEDLEIIERIEREGLQRDYVICQRSNEARGNILAFIDELVGESSSPRAQEILEKARVNFAPLSCPPPPPRPDRGG